jgi:hypothetical protein
MDEIDWNALTFSWSNLIEQASTGNFTKANGASINYMNDRVFLATEYNGEFYHSTIEGLSPLAKALHCWGARDSQLFVESSVGAMAIVGQSQTSNVNPAWPAYENWNSAGIAISGFAINDKIGGSGWAGYFDAVRMAGAGFTPGIELCTANFGPTHAINPFNHLTGVSNSVNMWTQTGNGLDYMEGALQPQGISCWDVNHSDAYEVRLTSYSLGTVTDWTNNTAYNVGDLVRDVPTQIVYRCKETHISNISGTMGLARMNNPARWKARPAAIRGTVYTAGALAELAPGTNIFSAMMMQERTQIDWWRGNAGYAEQSAYIWCDHIPMGKPAVGIRFASDMVSFENANIAVPAGAGLWVGGKKVVGNQKPCIASPNAEIWSLKYAVDQIRQLLADHGLMSPS